METLGLRITGHFDENNLLKNPLLFSLLTALSALNSENMTSGIFFALYTLLPPRRSRYEIGISITL